MKVYHSLAAYENGPFTISTIGTFDGVHLGHRFILDQIIEDAKKIGGESLLISFHPHPRLVLSPDDHSLKLLQTLEEKIRMLESIGLNKLLLIPFTKEFSKLSSEEYIQKVLLDTVQPHRVVIGYDHRFGKGREGGFEQLSRYAKSDRFELREIPRQAIDDAKISSTHIRSAIQEGKVEIAHQYLGYPYSFAGEVIHGEKQGRKLGYPTANIEPEDSLKLIPADGVYFVKVLVKEEPYYGMMSIGKKPTMGEFARTHEVNIFDFQGNIYGEVIRVAFLNYIRGEKKFNSLDELILAMEGDQAYCMRRIQELEEKNLHGQP